MRYFSTDIILPFSNLSCYGENLTYNFEISTNLLTKGQLVFLNLNIVVHVFQHKRHNKIV